MLMFVLIVESLLEFPEKYRARLKPTPMAALCLVLYRLSWPLRLFEFEDKWGHSDTWISLVFTDTVVFWAKRYQRVLEWCPLLTHNRIEQYASAIRKVEPSTNGKIWGFIDGTFTGFSRPVNGQRAVYSGHKKHHGFKYQAIVTPDGLVMSLFGPFEGKANDNRMAQETDIDGRLAALFNDHGDGVAVLFGDQAYSSYRWILMPYPNARDRDEVQFNIRMSSVRIAVEQAFGLAKNNWALNAYDNALKSGLQPVAAYFEVSILFTNLLTCFNHWTCANSRFQTAPPSPLEYLTSADEPERRNN